MNKSILTGRLTKDIDFRTAQSGTSIARFTLAVDRRRKDDGADFISCVAFGKTADLMDKYVSKGQKVGIIGHIQTGSYEKDGRKTYTTDIIVDEVEFLERKKEKEQVEQYDYQNDLPF